MRMPALSFLTVVASVLVAGSTAFAQSSGGTNSCQTTGPALADTVAYISKHANLTDVSIDQEHGLLTYNGSHHFMGAISLHYMKAKCGGVHMSSDRVFLPCPDNVACLFKEDGSEVPGRDKFDVFAVTGGDPDAAENLARAFSHLLYLLQSNYRAAHKDSQDPFALH